MRNLLSIAALGATLIASPALAQHRDRARAAPTVEQAAATLSNPAVQAGVAEMIGQLAGAFLDTHVGPVAMLTDPRDDVRAEDTLGDVVRRDDPYFDERLRAKTRRSLAVAGQAARGAGAMTRELQATADRLRAVLSQIDRY